MIQFGIFDENGRGAIYTLAVETLRLCATVLLHLKTETIKPFANLI